MTGGRMGWVRKRAIPVLAFAIAVSFLASCIPAKIGDPCGPTSDLGYDDDFILNCQDGRYAPFVTKAVAFQWWALLLEDEEQNQQPQQPNPPSTPAPPSTPPPPSGNPVVTKVVTGINHSCAMRNDGRVKCWGSNGSSQLAVPAGGASAVPVSVGMPGGARVTDLSAGPYHTCAILQDKRVACWGSNNNAQGGLPGPSVIEAARIVPGVTDARQITASTAGPLLADSHTCVINGSALNVTCWGSNGMGQLGQGSTSPAELPVQVPGLSGVRRIGAGGQHTCAVPSDNRVYCWGSNTHGQLGNKGSVVGIGIPSPVVVTNSVNNPVGGFTQVDAGAAHSCARLASGGVYCWGRDLEGQLGNDAAFTSKNYAVNVPGISTNERLGIGAFHSCAISTLGNGRCWGWNSQVQLGALTDPPGKSATPVVVNALNEATGIDGGHLHTCASDDTNRGHCWGFNGSGQLGNGSVHNNLSAAPTLPI